MFDQIDDRENEDSDFDNDPHWKIVQVALYAIVMLVVTYLWLSEYGRLIGIVGSVVLTLAAFAAYQWVSVWLHARRQERGPEDDGAPIALNLSSSDPGNTGQDDE